MGCRCRRCAEWVSLRDLRAAKPGAAGKGDGSRRLLRRVRSGSRVVPKTRRRPVESCVEDAEGRIVVPFNVAKAMQGLERERSPGSSEEALQRLRRYQELYRAISGREQMLRSVQGSAARTIAAYRSSEALRPTYKVPIVNPNLLSTASLFRTPNYFGASKLFTFPTYGKPAMSEILAPSMGLVGRIKYPAPRPLFTGPGYEGVFGNLGLSGAIARMFEAHGLVSAHGAAWNLQRLQYVRTPGLQAILKATTPFGPIVVSPDHVVPFDYAPDLRGLIPETATETEDAIDFEEMWSVVVAVAQGIAQHHHSKVFIRGVARDGRSFLVQVAGTVVGGLILYWVLHL